MKRRAQMRPQAFLFMQGLVISPHNQAPAPAVPVWKGRLKMANLFPPNDEQFSVALGNFITVANADPAAYGLTAADVTALTAAKDDLDDRIAGSEAAKEAGKTATVAKTTS